jgi:hypothetical protein
VVEVWEVEFGLLTGDSGEVFGDCHGTLLLELRLLIAGDTVLWNRISAGSQGGGFSGRAKLGIRRSSRAPLTVKSAPPLSGTSGRYFGKTGLMFVSGEGVFWAELWAKT